MEPGTRSRGAGAPTSTRADLAALVRDCGASRRDHTDASGAVLLGATPRLHRRAKAKGDAAAKSVDPKLTPTDQRTPSSTTERCSGRHTPEIAPHVEAAVREELSLKSAQRGDLQ